MIAKEKIDEIVKKIADSVRPEKIVLFGSYATGNPTKHSDLDICIVVKNGNGKNRELAGEIRGNLLYGYLIPMDIIVYSTEEIEEWKNVEQAFPTEIMRKGKVLYERQN